MSNVKCENCGGTMVIMGDWKQELCSCGHVIRNETMTDKIDPGWLCTRLPAKEDGDSVIVLRQDGFDMDMIRHIKEGETWCRYPDKWRGKDTPVNWFDLIATPEELLAREQEQSHECGECGQEWEGDGDCPVCNPTGDGREKAHEQGKRKLIIKKDNNSNAYLYTDMISMYSVDAKRSYINSIEDWVELAVIGHDYSKIEKIKELEIALKLSNSLRADVVSKLKEHGEEKKHCGFCSTEYSVDECPTCTTNENEKKIDELEKALKDKEPYPSLQHWLAKTERLEKALAESEKNVTEDHKEYKRLRNELKEKLAKSEERVKENEGFFKEQINENTELKKFLVKEWVSKMKECGG